MMTIPVMFPLQGFSIRQNTWGCINSQELPSTEKAVVKMNPPSPLRQVEETQATLNEEILPPLDSVQASTCPVKRDRGLMVTKTMQRGMCARFL